jgi:hypothetical protein
MRIIEGIVKTGTGAAMRHLSRNPGGDIDQGRGPSVSVRAHGCPGRRAGCVGGA